MNIALHSEIAGNPAARNSIENTLLDHLVAEHFEHVFGLLSTFVEDPEETLALTQMVFHAMAESAEASTLELYRHVANVIRGLENWNGFMESAARDSVLSWMLKETTPLNYAMIGQVMDLGYEEVKQGIASVRSILIDLV